MNELTHRDFSQFVLEHWVIFRQDEKKIFTVDLTGLIRIFTKTAKQELADVRKNKPVHMGCASFPAIKVYNELP